MQRLRAYEPPSIVKVEESVPVASNQAGFFSVPQSSSSSSAQADMIMVPLLPEAVVENVYAAAMTCEQAKQYAQAASCYQQAIQHGHVKAKTGLAMLHLQKRVEQPDKVKAHQLLLEAAEAGHGRAMQNVARQFEKGDGVEANPERACYWYGRGAEVTGDKRALEKYQTLTMSLSGSSGALAMS